MWGVGSLSHDRQCFKFLKDTFKDDLVVAEITEFLHGRTWLTQTRRLNIFDQMQSFAKKKLYHKHHKWSPHMFMQIAYIIESTFRTKYIGENALRDERKKELMIIFHEMAMPLTNAAYSRFCLFENGDGSKVAKLLTKEFNFKPKAVAALMAVAADTDGKKKRRKKDGASTTDAQPQSDPASESVVVPEQRTIRIYFGTLLSNIIDEGCWQLLSQNVNIDAIDDCTKMTTELLTMGALIGLGQGPIDVGSQEAPQLVNDLSTFRDHAHARLGDFCRGYMVVKNIKPPFEPTKLVIPSSASTDASSLAPVIAGQVARQHW